METLRNIINFDAIKVDKSMLDTNNNLVETNNILNRAGFGTLPNYRNSINEFDTLEKYKQLYLKLLLVKFATDKYLEEVIGAISSLDSKVTTEKIVDVVKKYFDAVIEPASNTITKISLTEIYENIRTWYKNNYPDEKPPTSRDVRNYCKTNFTAYDDKTDRISGYKFRNMHNN